MMSLKCGYSFPDLYFPMVLKTVMSREVCSFDYVTCSLNINAFGNITSNACQHCIALLPSCLSGFSGSGHDLDSCILIC